MSERPFDFRKPPPDELIRKAGAWLAESSRLAAPIWAKLLPFKTEIVTGPPEVIPAGLALPRFGTSVAGLTINVDPFDTLLSAFPRRLLLAILAGLMNESPTALPADRELTNLESTLCEYFVRELLIPPLQVAWPLPEPLRLSAGPRGLVGQLWRLPATEPLLVSEFTLKTPFGDHGFHLLLPKSEWLEALATPVAARVQSQSPTNRRLIETLVGEMNVDLAVVLGTADLTLFDLVRLRTGDLVMLNQKVDDPLEATVGGTKKFRVWPGARGSRQAVQVFAHEPTPDDPRSGAEGTA